MFSFSCSCSWQRYGSSLDRAICDRIAGTIRIGKFREQFTTHYRRVEWASEIAQMLHVVPCRRLGETPGGGKRRDHGADDDRQICPGDRKPFRRWIENASQQLHQHPGGHKSRQKPEADAAKEDEQSLAPKERGELPRPGADSAQYREVASALGEA